MNKKYWLRGLLTGLVIYVLAVLIAYVTDNGPEFRGLATLIIAVYSLPVIPIGLLVGWIYGKSKKKSNLVSQ
jgi:hypothetical protein